MAFVVNVEESQHNPAVEHIDEEGRQQFVPSLACKQLRRRVKPILMTVRAVPLMLRCRVWKDS